MSFRALPLFSSIALLILGGCGGIMEKDRMTETLEATLATYGEAIQSVAVLGMRNGTSQSPFRPALGRQLVRAADAPLRGHGFGTSRLRQTPTTNGLTAYRMRLHLACVSSGTYGPFATSASRSRLRLPRTTRLALRASLAGSERFPFSSELLKQSNGRIDVHDGNEVDESIS